MLGRPRVNPFSTRSTSLAGAGAPPPPTLASDDVSYLVNAGLSSMSQLCVGTPTKVVTRSDSIRRSAVSGSLRCIITSFNFMPKHDSITGTQPVTWNSGTMRMKHGGLPPPASGLSPPLRADRMVAPAQKAIIDWVTARWVDTAPLG